MLNEKLLKESIEECKKELMERMEKYNEMYGNRGYMIIEVPILISVNDEIIGSTMHNSIQSIYNEKVLEKQYKKMLKNINIEK